MGVTTTKTNKPLNPRGNDQSPLAFNRAKLYSGKALDFDGGNDLVTTTYTSGFTGTQEFTYCAYINAHTNQQTQTIVHGNENVGWGLQSLQVRTETNGIRFFAGTGSSSTSYVDSDPIEANKWYFVVGTHTPTENKIYLNGALNATATAANLTAAPQAITIGAHPWATVAFNGEISSPRIFNTALTAAQVADLYNNPEKVVPTGVDNTALKLWLPMMEGAGTTAYDGSGNGNHGTISGATYVNGVGAPVAQSAVMDWNKDVNLAPYSEDFTQPAYLKTNATITANNIVAPNGLTTGAKVTLTDDAQSGVRLFTPMNVGAYTMKYFAKAGTITNAKFYQIEQNVAARTMDVDLVNGTISNVPSQWDDASIEDAGNGWFLISVTYTIITYGPSHGYGAVALNESGNYFYLWGFHHKEASTLDTYVPNYTASSITSPVLLPQGLTSGRDITGVNLFENVRKQGALNLDGNSWAEVHDNESLDFGTGSFTLEAWVRAKFVNTGSALNVVLNLGGNASNAGAVCMLVGSTNKVTAVYNNSYLDSNTILTEGEWYHLVVNFNGTHSQIYINGAFDKNIARTAADISNALVKEIGRDSTIARTYKDQIAQPRIYDRALNASEIERNYNAGKNIYK